MNRKILTACIFLALLPPSTSFADREHNDIQFETISRGGQSGIDHQMSMVVRNRMHWEHMWMMHSAGVPAPERMPEIDFNTHMVVAHFLGPVASCGYRIQTDEITEKRFHLKAEVELTVPEGDVQCLIAEQPFEMIKLRKINKIFQFEMDTD